MKLTFLGAAETVTGSRFLLEAAGKRILIDCGLFQGLKKLRQRNWAPFPISPASIDAVILTMPILIIAGIFRCYTRKDSGAKSIARRSRNMVKR